jgi:hypothetical protein
MINPSDAASAENMDQLGSSRFALFYPFSLPVSPVYRTESSECRKASFLLLRPTPLLSDKMSHFILKTPSVRRIQLLSVGFHNSDVAATWLPWKREPLSYLQEKPPSNAEANQTSTGRHPCSLSCCNFAAHGAEGELKSVLVGLANLHAENETA